MKRALLLFSLLFGFLVPSLKAQDFITVWDMSLDSVNAPSGCLEFYAFTAGTVNYTWELQNNPSVNGSGTFTANNSQVSICTGQDTGRIVLSIAPANFHRFYSLPSNEAGKRLIDVSQWGATFWTSCLNMFYGCENLQGFSAADAPDLRFVSTMAGMFHDAKSFNSRIDHWDVSGITTMNVMFENAEAFNSPLQFWDVSSLQSAISMFQNAKSFDQPISNWNVSNTTMMMAMFMGASSFNKPIGSWDVSSVTDMTNMFNGAASFDQPLADWDVSNVSFMAGMFANSAFNQSIENWDVSQVQFMTGMFSGSEFNQPLEGWDITSVFELREMFLNNTSFNQPLDGWDVSNVRNMRSVFKNAVSFNQPLGSWELSGPPDMRNMLDSSGMDCENYRATLSGWAANPNTFNGLTLGAQNIPYGDNAQGARDSLITNNFWSINGDYATTDCGVAGPPADTSSFVTVWDLSVDYNGGPDGCLEFFAQTSGDVEYQWEVRNNPAINGSGSFNENGFLVTICTGQPDAEIVLSLKPDNLRRFFFQFGYQSGDRLTEVAQWGTTQWRSCVDMFHGCENLTTFSAQDTPDLSRVTNASSMFEDASAFNQPIGNWDVSSITDMSSMFLRANSFNQDIGGWDVSGVTNMNAMFNVASAFNQDIGNWNLSNATDLSFMFGGAVSFNQDIGNWDVSNVTQMQGMFNAARVFNQDLGNWDVSSVTNMRVMFYGAWAFNQNIEGWDVSAVTRMDKMFQSTRAFNQPLNYWDVSSVTEMYDMFKNAEAFNQDISSWDISSVISLSRMFEKAKAFNQDISSWNFKDAPLLINSMQYMVDSSGMDCNNYSRLLIELAKVETLPTQDFFAASGLKYGINGGAARDQLTANGWGITGDQPSGNICVIIPCDQSHILLSGPMETCSSENVCLQATDTATTSNTTYLWRLPNGSTTATDTSKQLCFTANENQHNGTFWVVSVDSVSGCRDSASHDLTVHPQFYQVITAHNLDCGSSYTSPGGNVLTSSGTYYDTLSTANGCDSIFEIQVSFSDAVSKPISLFGCSSVTLPGGTQVFDSGTYTDSVSYAGTCDTNYTVSVTIEQYLVPIYPPLQDCGTSYEAPSGKSFTSSGIYYDTLNTVNGCDSVLEIHLNFGQFVIRNITATGCQSVQLPSGKTVTESGLFFDTLSVANACDTLFRVNTTIYQPQFSDSTYNLGCGTVFTSPTGQQFTETGLYYDTLSTANGCDSIVAMNLNFSPFADRTINLSGCEQVSLPSGRTVTESGLYVDTASFANVCDTIYQANVTVYQPQFSTSFHDLSCGAVFESPTGKLFTETGIYKDTLATQNGCDSVLTLYVTFASFVTKDLVLAGCEEVVLPSGTVVFESGNYTDLVQYANTCDTSFNVSVSVYNTEVNTLTYDLACGDQFETQNGQIITSNGTYYDTLTSALGCDSILQYQINFATAVTKSISLEGCGQVVLPSGTLVSESGMYSDLVSFPFACDTLYQVAAVVNSQSTEKLEIEACAPITSPSGYEIANTGLYYDTLPNPTGCDKLFEIAFSRVDPDFAIQDTLHVTACNPYQLPSGQVVEDGGTFVDTSYNAYQCPSVQLIHVTFEAPSIQVINANACGAYTAPNGDVYAESGVYFNRFTNAAGCDSIVKIILDLVPLVRDTVDITACGQYIASSENIYHQSGFYVDTVRYDFGCDTIKYINLTIVESVFGYQEVSDCDFVWSQSDNIAHYASGTYYDTLTTALGCDSILRLDFVAPTTASRDSQWVQSCEPLVLSNGAEITTPGLYVDTVITEGYCGQIVPIVFTTNPVFDTTYTTLCEPAFIDDSTLVTTSTLLVDTLAGAGLCDTVRTHVITVLDSSNIQVTASGLLLSVLGPVDAIQWLDCDKDFAPVIGATDVTFVGALLGSYAAEVTRNGCTDTTACIKILSTTSVNESTEVSPLNVYPNPNQEGIITVAGLPENTQEISVIAQDGKVMHQIPVHHAGQVKVALPNTAGVYFIEVRHHKGMLRKKVVRL